MILLSPLNTFLSFRSLSLIDIYKIYTFKRSNFFCGHERKIWDDNQLLCTAERVADASTRHARECPHFFSFCSLTKYNFFVFRSVCLVVSPATVWPLRPYYWWKGWFLPLPIIMNDDAVVDRATGPRKEAIIILYKFILWRENDDGILVFALIIVVIACVSVSPFQTKYFNDRPLWYKNRNVMSMAVWDKRVQLSSMRFGAEHTVVVEWYL